MTRRAATRRPEVTGTAHVEEQVAYVGVWKSRLATAEWTLLLNIFFELFAELAQPTTAMNKEKMIVESADWQLLSMQSS